MNEHAALVERGRERVQAAPQLFIDLDVEADGIAGYGSLLSIGAVSPWGDTYYRELKPTSDLYVPEQRAFCEAHGLQRERLLREGQEPAEAVAELAQWQANLLEKYAKTDAKIVAFNAGFDHPWINLEYLKDGQENPFGVAGYCIKSLAMALSKSYDWRETSKGRLPAEIIPEGDFTHNALEDAIYQQKLHFAMSAVL